MRPALGACIKGRCQCKSGYTGDNCGTKLCFNDCNGHGKCVDGQCECHENWKGKICEIKQCSKTCNNHGLCIKDECFCDFPYTGPNCENLVINITFNLNSYVNSNVKMTEYV